MASRIHLCCRTSLDEALVSSCALPYLKQRIVMRLEFDAVALTAQLNAISPADRDPLCVRKGILCNRFQVFVDAFINENLDSVAQNAFANTQHSRI